MLTHTFIFQTKDCFAFSAAEPLCDTLTDAINNTYSADGVVAGCIVTEGGTDFEIEVAVSNIPTIKIWDDILEAAKFILESILPR
jgi:hypothetical protein